MRGFKQVQDKEEAMTRRGDPSGAPASCHDNVFTPQRHPDVARDGHAQSARQ